MMKKMAMIILLLAGLILAACNAEEEGSGTEEASLDIEQLVHEYSTGTFKDVSASITSNELIVTNENNEEEIYDLPEDKFFLSIAPFEEVTHPCFDHSLTGCQGEMVKEAFAVEITDSEGNIVVNETMETMDNGFIDLWLPRNDEFEVKISHEGKTAEEVLSTYEGDGTCVTTMQLL